MLYIKFLCGFILSFVVYTNADAQWRFKTETHRQIYINTDTGKIQATISTTKKTRPNLVKTYYWSDQTLIRHTQGGYSGYLLDGDYTEYYYPQKNIYIKGRFSKGLKNGNWIYWNPGGIIRETSNWQNGTLGKRVVYDNNGKMAKEELYRKGKLRSYKMYANDTIVSTVKLYDTTSWYKTMLNRIDANLSPKRKKEKK